LAKSRGVIDADIPIEVKAEPVGGKMLLSNVNSVVLPPTLESVLLIVKKTLAVVPVPSLSR
jgi:hypothetical protein